MREFYVIFLLSIYSTVLFAGNINDYPIKGNPSATLQEAKKWAHEMNATPLFIDSADLFWHHSASRSIDPLVAYIQAAKVTNFGHAINTHNTGGISKTDNSGKLVIFDCLESGIKAQLDHLALYAGVSGYPRKYTKDPRHFSSLLGKAKTVRQLGGKWGSSDYGINLAKMMDQFHSNNKSQNLPTDIMGMVAINDYDRFSILGVPDITLEELKTWARKKRAEPYFVELADIFWKKSLAVGVNPVIAFCQAAKETGWGRYGGSVKIEHKNTCGLKIKNPGKNDVTSDFMRFNSWEDGIEAHIDHLALYAEAPGYPKKTTKDPRHNPSLKGKAKRVTDLGNGIWAKDPNYGKALSQMIESIR